MLQSPPTAPACTNELEQAELPVTFFPPLSQQRRAWVFEVLTREKVTSILDIGCGEGDLIACLCNPAPWLPPSHHAEIRAFLESQELPSIEYIIHEEPYMHPVRVIGLDISAVDLCDAIKHTSPPKPTALSWPRWIPLDVEIWEGGLQSLNPVFMDVECIVSTEVIEHLPEEVLQDFAPVILGVYQPRLLLITTPSYTFNARFTAPDAPPSARRGFPDPTGRTDRIFRHSDHKFEWTVEEFTDWCETVADDWGYEAQIRGVGKPNEKDEWDRDESLGWASQVAMFRRKEGDVWKKVRLARREQVGILSRASQSQHRLLATHRHDPHKSAGHPLPLRTIGDLTHERLLDYGIAAFPVGRLWTEGELDIPCGGCLELLVLAAAKHNDLAVRCNPAEKIEKWEILLKSGLPSQCTKSVNDTAQDVVVDTSSEFLVSQTDNATWGNESSSWGVMTTDDWNVKIPADDWGWGVPSRWETNEP
ncbi:hypothetical protein CERSUDRAFT_145359 [Gelatoporia subvermispora B]|uniref:Small RNA 2'-O-methyltransferase n=1 Tax=Ceriporiopsis subvermispora (strain B) TaxID=914234 RepID=M2Q3I0_CERS8|nr:hypothetical protein CERSUDRAFT_145359 [Gelatoporia subvermispora B]